MKTITVRIDDQTYHKARLLAAEKGTSVSAMVREILACVTADNDGQETRRIESLEELFREADARATPRPTPLVPLTRAEIYDERLR